MTENLATLYQMLLNTIIRSTMEVLAFNLELITGWHNTVEFGCSMGAGL